MAGKPGKSGGRRRGAGRKRFQPTEQQRRQVFTWAACAVKQEVMVQLLTDPPISIPTLQKHFRKELDTAAEQANANVVQSLYEQAVGADAKYDKETGQLLRPAQPRIPAAAIFWCKGRLGWREVSENRHSGPDGGAIPFTRLDSLSDAQLDQLLKRLVPSTGD